MANDRGRRGGRAGAKGGRAGGRGRGSNQADPTGRQENGGGGGRGGPTGGARGARGQLRRAGRGGKRAGGSDAAAGAGGLLPGVKSRRGTPTNKKMKTGEEKVLWGPGRVGKGDSSLSTDGPDTGGGSDTHGQSGNRGARPISSLATPVKQPYIEDLDSDDDEVEHIDGAETVEPHSSARQTRDLSGGGVATAVEETARSMSPAKLAAEVQKARARAREERFGSGSKSLLARTSPVGRPAGQEPPASTLPPENASRLVGVGASEREATAEKNRANVSAASLSSRLPAASAATRTPSPHVEASSEAAGTSRTPLTDVTAVVAGAHHSLVAKFVSPLPTRSELSSVPRASAPSASAVAMAVVSPTDTEEEEEEANVPNPSEKSITAEVVLLDEASERSAAPKRPVPEGGRGDVAVVEPPAKKVLASSSRGGDVPEKVHTLRLRLRTDALDALPARNFDGGVEESKGFVPPNPPRDNGVEECKGFDPPNLPPTPRREPPARASPAVPGAASLPSNSAAQPTGSQPSLSKHDSGVAKAAAPTTAVSCSSLGDGGAPTSGLARQPSWGPSFGISDKAGTGAAVATFPLIAPQRNPWILSPTAPTFAKNQGRPLARSFSHPTADNTGASIAEDRGSARPGEGAEANVVRPLLASNRGDENRGGRARDGGSRGERSASGRAGTPASTNTLPGNPPPTPRVDVDALAKNLAGSRQNHTPPTGAGYPSRPSAGQGGLSPREPAAATGGEKEDAEDDSGPVIGGAAADDPRPGEVVLGVRVRGRAGELVERLKREREESLDFERKLTQALLDL